MTRGRWVFVCGPSGAGKDTVLGRTRDRVQADSRIVFSQRLVTREAEPHALQGEVRRETLERQRIAGRLAWHWEAHGLAYGIDASYAAQVDAGRVVVVNGSRQHLATLAPDPRIQLVLVTAPPGLLQARLDARGREGRAEVAQRMARNGLPCPWQPALVLRNDGPIDVPAARLAAYLRSLAGD